MDAIHSQMLNMHSNDGEKSSWTESLAASQSHEFHLLHIKAVVQTAVHQARFVHMRTCCTPAQHLMEVISTEDAGDQTLWTGRLPLQVLGLLMLSTAYALSRLSAFSGVRHHYQYLMCSTRGLDTK